MSREQIAQMRARISRDIPFLFGMLDSNSDGLIDRDELRAKMERGFEPIPEELSKGMTKDQQIEMFFKVADTDADGKVSQDELAAYFEKMFDDLEVKLYGKKSDKTIDKTKFVKPVEVEDDIEEDFQLDEDVSDGE